MYEILKNGGLAPGGLNFDCKVRRGSFELEDLFIGHIVGFDAFAYGLKVAYKLLQSGELEQFVEERYASYTKGIGKEIVDGTADFKKLEAYALDLPEITNKSGRQEVLESIINRYMLQG